MPTIEFTPSDGGRIHIWARPSDERSGADVASVSIVDRKGETILREVGPTHDYQMLAVEAAVPGAISWDADVTDVSLIYCYDAASVGRRGITVLFTTERNAAARRRFRFHLSPPFGWMNDPNGLCVVDGRIHLFYQHYPHARRWRAMHWGHAVTDNLVDWVHLPVFLHPRAEILANGAKVGGAYSGSAVTAPDGTLRVFYTDRDNDRLPNWEWQMTTTSRDLISAAPSVPVVVDRPPEPDTKRDNRDSYVFKGPDGRWKMILGGANNSGGQIYLYETDAENASEGWRYVGVLYHEPDAGPRSLECPSLVRLDGREENLHLLIFGVMGMRDRDTRRRFLSFAVVGRFDGRVFEPVKRFELDFGTDAYAFQAINHEDRVIAIAWAANWSDVFKDTDYASCMSLPRQLSYDGARLLSPPAEETAALRETLLSSGEIEGTVRLDLNDGLGELLLDVDGASRFQIGFAHPSHQIDLEFDGDTLTLHFVAPTKRSLPRYLRLTGPLRNLRIFVDVGLIEIFADDGAHCCTKRLESDEPFSSLDVSLEGARSGAYRFFSLRPVRDGIRYAGTAGEGHAAAS